MSLLTAAATANNCSMGMTATNFEAAKKSIQAKNFDDSKLIIAKQILDNNCLKCSQIKELMGLFSFEGSKLEIAKYAWHHVVDKGNYFTINDAFTFDSSVDELNEDAERPAPITNIFFIFFFCCYKAI
ncbi:MAG: DUF4476 domain-containing protein [Bacteroidetes bacterium]|nr:DUF4476 domain-containing protein [Bacteroidota bacterium]